MLKQFLLASCVFALAASATAADITNPFYLPSKGQMGSITSMAFQKTKVKGTHAEGLGPNIYSKEYSNSSFYDKILQEELQYGLTDNLSLIANVGNTFAKEKYGEGFTIYDEGTPVDSEGYSVSDKTDYNPQWSAGLSWNVLTGPAKLQLMAKYGQDKAQNTGKGEYKYVTAEAKFGYQFQKFLPYVSVGEELPVAQEHGNNKPEYNAKIGLYQGACEKWALDTGLRWIHAEGGEMNLYLAEAEASYYLTPKSAVSIYGTYSLDSEIKRAQNGVNFDMKDKSVGVRLRWFF